MEEITPVHAQGFFAVSEKGLVTQFVVFDYYDPEGYYGELVGDVEALEEELEALVESMQDFLDRERVLINGRRTRPRVVDADLGFRGTELRPFVTFLIQFEGEFRRGLNTYENWYEKEEAEYDFEAYWAFPPGSRVVEVAASGLWEILGEGRLLVIRVHRGEEVEGYEKIAFELP